MFCVHVFFDDVYNVLVYINIVVVIPLVRGNIFILKKIEFLYRYIFLNDHLYYTGTSSVSLSVLVLEARRVI